MQDILSITRNELGSYLSSRNIPSVHKDEIFKVIYRDLTFDFSKSSKLPAKANEVIFKDFYLNLPKIILASESKYDQSIKFVLEFSDAGQIEMVLMPEKNRITLCVSSQIGCRQKCTFCHTGRMGLKRNLTAAEIVVQPYLANRWIRENYSWLIKQKLGKISRVTNIVFMGMGEPMDNVDSLLKSIDILKDPFGPEIAPRKITVSTAGHLDGLNKFTKICSETAIAISLHGTNNSERSKVMPINKTWPLESIIKWIEDYNTHTKKSILLQYTLINSVNDTEEHALRLAELFRNLDVKINLIPFNQIDPSLFKSPAPERLENFKSILIKEGLLVLVRYSKGQDIGAACGQLVRND